LGVGAVLWGHIGNVGHVAAPLMLMNQQAAQQKAVERDDLRLSGETHLAQSPALLRWQKRVPSCKLIPSGTKTT
jgi:hypothetical protein